MADSVSHPPSSANGQQEGESSEFDTYMELRNECRAIAPRVYSKHRQMFRDLPSMYNLELEFQTAPLRVKIKEMRGQLDLLKSLDNAPLFGSGVHQMDGDIGESSGNPSQGLALHQPAAAPHPPPPGRGLRTKSCTATTQQRNGPGKSLLDRPQSTAVSLKKAPPMPPSFGRGIHKKGAADSLNAQELWEFTYRTLCESQTAMGNNEIASAYCAYLKTQGREAPKAAMRKWEGDRMLLLQMFDLACVTIPYEHVSLRKSLLTFWQDFSRETLAMLTEWLQSGNAASLRREDLLAEAVSYIRSARKTKGGWWPDHGTRVDTWCLTNGVVTEARLFEEWTVSKNPDDAGQHTFFEAEHAQPHKLAVRTRVSVNKVNADGGRRQLMAAVTRGSGGSGGGCSGGCGGSGGGCAEAEPVEARANANSWEPTSEQGNSDQEGPVWTGLLAEGQDAAANAEGGGGDHARRGSGADEGQAGEAGGSAAAEGQDAAAAADSEGAVQGGGGDSQQAAAAAERRLPAAKGRLDSTSIRTAAKRGRSSIRNAAKRGAVRNTRHLELAGADEGEAGAAADEGEAGGSAAAEGQDAGAADEGSGKDHARRGSGGRGGEGLGKRSRRTTNLRYTMLAETGKMSWADACYYSLCYSNLDFDKKVLACSTYALATVQDTMRTEEIPDSSEGGGGGNCGGGGRRRSYPAASRLPTNAPSQHITEHTSDCLAKPADVEGNRQRFKSGMTRTRGPSQQCMEPLEPSQMIVGNKVSVLYDNGSWYHGQIARIAQTGKAGKGKVLEIVFDDGDELTLYTWKKKDTEGFRHDAERDDPITRRWGVVYRLLCTCGEDQWFQRCHIAGCGLPDELENLKTKIMTGACAPLDLDKLEAFLIQEAVERKSTGGSSEWAEDVLAQLESCVSKRRKSAACIAAGRAQERDSRKSDGRRDGGAPAAGAAAAGGSTGGSGAGASGAMIFAVAAAAEDAGAAAAKMADDGSVAAEILQYEKRPLGRCEPTALAFVDDWRKAAAATDTATRGGGGGGSGGGGGGGESGGSLNGGGVASEDCDHWNGSAADGGLPTEGGGGCIAEEKNSDSRGSVGACLEKCEARTEVEGDGSSNSKVSDPDCGDQAAAAREKKDGIQQYGIQQYFLQNITKVRQSAICLYCGKAGNICCVQVECQGSVCQLCWQWKNANAVGFLCDLHRMIQNTSPTIRIRSTFCLECGPSRHAKEGRIPGKTCGLCGKRLCHFHAQTTPSALSVFKDPKRIEAGNESGRRTTRTNLPATNSRCRTCFGTDIVGFETLREMAARLLLGTILGESSIDKLIDWHVDRMRRCLESRLRMPENTGKRLSDLAEEFSAFVFSLVCCGLGRLAGRLMRILMTLNLALESHGLSFATPPFQLFFMLNGSATQMAGPCMLAKSVQSHGRYILAQEQARRRKNKAVTFPVFGDAEARANQKIRMAIALSDALEKSAGLDLMFGTIMHFLEHPELEIWLIVRTPLTTVQLEAGTHSPFDDSYPPAKALQAALGNDRIIYICSNHLDDHLVTVGMQYHWNVILHLHGFNHGHFWRSLVMAKLAEVYLDAVGMASLSLTNLVMYVDAAYWTVTGLDLVSKVQLAIRDREPLFIMPCIYQTEAWYQDLVLSWGDPPPPSGPPGLLYGGECTRITETGGADFLQALIDIMHQTSVNHGVNIFLHFQGPTSKLGQIIEFARDYCVEANYDKKLHKRIVQFPFFRDKEDYEEYRWGNYQLLPVSGDPLGPHTGSADGAVALSGSLHWSTLGEWQSKVPAAINEALGLGHVLNTAARPEFVKRGVELMAHPQMMLAMRMHNLQEMKSGRGFYCKARFADAVTKTLPHCLELARKGLHADERYPDVDSREHFKSEPSPKFVFLAKPVPPVEDSIAMKVNEVMQVLASKGVVFDGPWKAGAESLVEKMMEVVTFDPESVRRGGARVTFQGDVKKPENDAVQRAIAWNEHRRALAKIEYPREGRRVIGPGDVHNSENVREGQNYLAIQSILGKSGRMRRMAPSLMPLLDGGRASLGFVKVELGPKLTKSNSTGLLICLFCEVVPEGTDMFGSKILKDVQVRWRDHGEISENARAIARNILHTGTWFRQQTGLTQLDISLGNLFCDPWSEISAPWLDQTIRNRLSDPANVGWCDLGGCINVETLSARKDKQVRPGMLSAVPGLMRNATQADADPSTKAKPRFPNTDKSGFGVLTNLTLTTFAEHRRQNSAGIGRPTGGTPEYTHQGMKEQFDNARQDERVAADAAAFWESYGEGVVIFQQFVPRECSSTTGEYIMLRDKAAVSPEAVLNCMTRQLKEGVTIQQPKIAAQFANLIHNLLSRKVTNEVARTHPVLTHHIFTKEVQSAINGEGYLIPGRVGPPGNEYAGQESAPWCLKPDGPRGKWGTGACAARFIKAGTLSAWYVALAHSPATTKTSLHEYPPGIANVTLNDGTEPELTALGELPLELLHELGAPGVFFNAKPAANGANLRLERRKRIIQNGLIYIPFVATHDILVGDFGYWEYDPNKGLGGADSFSFDDSIFGIDETTWEVLDASSAGL